jgi:hypothetical protein
MSAQTVNKEFIYSYTLLNDSTISRREKFDEDNLKKIILNNMIDKILLKKITNYSKERREAGIKEVHYSVGKNNIIKLQNGNILNVGRLFPDNGLSGMRRDIRNALTEKYYWDLDFVNAHYHLALYLCGIYDIPCENIKSYVENREMWLLKTHPNRKISKDQYLLVAFGGSIKNYDEEFECCDIDFEKSNEVKIFLELLKQEFKSLSLAVWADPKYELWKKIKSGKDKICLKDQPNPMFKLLSKVFQHIEKEHLLFLSSYLETKGRYMGVYIHDGGLIEKLDNEKEFPIDLIKECENAVNIQFGTNMKLLIKKIEYNITEFITENDLEKKVKELSLIDSYDVIKNNFEKNNFFVNDITSIAEIEEKDEYYDLIIRSKQKLFDRYAPLTYKEYQIKDYQIIETKHSFIEKWWKDDSRRTYKKIDFLPNKNCSNNIFNTFKCLRGEALCLKYQDITKDYVINLIDPTLSSNDNQDKVNLDLLRDHIMNLCGNDEKMYNYLVQWLAFIVQKRIQPQTALVFKSKQGTGKDLFWGFIYEFIIGKNMVAIPSDINDIVGRFTGMLENKLLVHINEVSGKDTFMSNDKIKLLITSQKEISIEKKGIDKRTTTNNMGFIFLSNNENPVMIEESDRRFCVFECSNEWIEKSSNERFQHFKELANILSNNINYAERLGVIFYLFLQNLDLSNFNILDIPKSNAYNEMKKSQFPCYYYWFKSICEDMESKGNKIFKCKSNELYVHFNEWKNFAGYSKYEITLTKFGRIINDLHFIEKKKISFIYYEINIDKLIEFLKSKDLYDEIFTE